MELYKTIRSQILDMLSNELSSDLYYHSLQHTIDVEEQAKRIAASEGVHNDEELFLLQVACLYHDSGFLFTYKDHEMAGCNFAKEQLAVHGFSKKQLDIICGMIMATKIPQSPFTKLEEIICDADLDYLGRDDFSGISNNLYLELKARNFVATENAWNLIQINFFKQHHYFTDSNIALRTHQKLNHLSMIEEMV